MPKQLTNQSERKGFTIIEVVLVLAIAGLIFLMVFVALPALQRSQRDTARRNDISRVGTSLVQWQTNHGTAVNKLPNAGSDTASIYDAGENGEFGSNCDTNVACEFVRDYMNSGVDGAKSNSFQDPDGDFYSVLITPNLANVDGGPMSFSAGAGLSYSNDKGYDITGENAYKAHVIYIVPGAVCSDDATAVKSSQRHYAVLYRLEGAGVYCLDDQ